MVIILEVLYLIIVPAAFRSLEFIFAKVVANFRWGSSSSTFMIACVLATTFKIKEAYRHLQVINKGSGIK